MWHPVYVVRPPVVISENIQVFIYLFVWRSLTFTSDVTTAERVCLVPLLACLRTRTLVWKFPLCQSRSKGTGEHFSVIVICYFIIYFIIIIGIQPLGRSGQRPEFSQATGMVLVRCILSKFLGVACHCFPPLFRRSHFSPPGASTSATTWEIPAAEVETVGENVVR